MGKENENDDIIDDGIRFPDEELSPEEEARLRGEIIDPDGGDDDDDVDVDALAELAGTDDDESGSPMVPHGRFHEVNERAKQTAAEAAAEKERADRLQAELDALKGGPGATPNGTPPADAEAAHNEAIKKLEVEYTEAMFEGETERAAEIRMQINEANQARAVEIAMERIRQDQAREREAEQRKAAVSQFEVVVQRMEQQYPQLDINNKDADHDAIALVVALRDQYIADGKSPAEALEAAATRTAERFGFAQVEQKPAGNRQTETVRRNAAAAAQQPPRMNAGTSDRSMMGSKKSVTEMSDKEFDNMDPEYERKLRGEA